MKIIVADRISEHGVKLLADPGWQVVQPAAAALASELAEADALVVRSATQVTDELLSHARRLRVIGRAGVRSLWQHGTRGGVGRGTGSSGRTSGSGRLRVAAHVALADH